MCNLARWSVVVGVCFGLVPVAWAVDPKQPFVSVSVPHDGISLGVVYGSGSQKTDKQLTVHVVANCPFYLRAGFRGLTHEGDKRSIAPNDMAVTINGKKVSVGASQTVVVGSGAATSLKGVDVSIDLQVEVTNLGSYPAGRYDGNLAVTVMAGL
jgi:hypothetical protein